MLVDGQGREGGPAAFRELTVSVEIMRAATVSGSGAFGSICSHQFCSVGCSPPKSWRNEDNENDDDAEFPDDRADASLF